MTNPAPLPAYEARGSSRGRRQRTRLGPRTVWSLIGVACGIAATELGVAVTGFGRLACWWPGIALVTLAFYGLDKLMARAQTRRIPEATLHLLALIGGSPGALAGMHLFRHKRAKLSFQLVLWAILAVQLVALGWYLATGDAP